MSHYLKALDTDRRLFFSLPSFRFCTSVSIVFQGRVGEVMFSKCSHTVHRSWRLLLSRVHCLPSTIVLEWDVSNFQQAKEPLQLYSVFSGMTAWGSFLSLR